MEGYRWRKQAMNKQFRWQWVWHIYCCFSCGILSDALKMILNHFEITARFVVILLVVLLLVPPGARGGAEEFIPKVYNMEGELDFDGTYQSNKNVTKGSGLDTSDAFLTEKIVLAANGFVYHPRLLLFLAKIGGGFSQENFKDDGGSSSGTAGWRKVFVHEYEFRTMFLPEHNYNLEFFALRTNPSIPGKSTWGTHPVITTEGTQFTYKRSPVFFRSGYNVSTLESGNSTTDTDTFITNAAYELENFSLAGSYSRTNSHTTSGSQSSDATSDKYSIQNEIRLIENRIILTSDVSMNSYTAESSSPSPGATTSQEGSRLAWTERLNMVLPWNFNALASYNHYEDTQKSIRVGFTEDERTATNDFTGVSLTHKLYESLSSAYNFRYATSNTPTGDSKVTTNSLNVTYTKKIPGGRFTGGGFTSKSISDTTRTPSVVNEVHYAQILGEFTLSGTDIDETTIRVDVRDTVTGAFVNMLNTDYRVLPVGNTARIQILSVPAQVLNPDPSYVYEFQVAYYSISGSSKFETSILGYSLKFALFNNVLNPYYDYSHQTEKILSGSITGEPDDITVKTVGVVLQRLPWYLLLEYQDYQSNINPSRRDRVEATFQQDITPTTYLSLRANYMKVDYLQSAYQTATGETGSTGSISVQKRFPEKNLTLNASAEVSRRKYIYETNTYSAIGALLWSVGKLEVGLGANVSRAETGLISGTQESIYQRYFLSVKRKLF